MSTNDEAYRFRDQLREMIADDKRREDAGTAMALLYDVPTAQIVIVELLKLMTNDERLALFGQIQNRYCIHCGTPERPGRYCQCNNDE